MNMKQHLWGAKSLILGACLALAAGTTFAQEETEGGPITSRLEGGRVLFYFYNFSTVDHQNTPSYGAYLMQLGEQHNFTVDTTRAQSVFTTANLAQYDVIFLFSAYFFGQQMSTAQKAAVEEWYGNNGGMACFHQCVRNSWGGDAPNWYDRLMGVEYQTYARFGTAPLYVDTQAVGTDLAMSASGMHYPAGTTFSFDDEWYTYLANPRNLPNTRMILYTRRQDHPNSASFNASLGDIQPLAWAREVEGGRFVLSSNFHRCNPIAGTIPNIPQCNASSRSAELADFIDGHFLGTLRYLAGYDGCTDDDYEEYNSKATHHDEDACVTLKSTGIRIAGQGSTAGMQISDLNVSITDAGQHVVEVFNARGARVAVRRGTGPREYDFTETLSPGMYHVRAKAPSGSVSKRVFLMQRGLGSGERAAR